MLSILLVEDDAGTRNAVQAAFTEAGHSVTSCPGGAEALEAVRRARPDLIIADLSEPSRDGFALLDEARRSDPSIPFLLISGAARPALDEASLRFGAIGILRRPVDPAELLQRVQAHFEKRR